ncbi:MAG: NYN domain-containing protein [Rubricoccaceae bacterium]|nr:NYN domain-containing protein [Rubricoccaceae bacterium]
MSDAPQPPATHTAAVLIDYQNLYHFLKNRLQSPAQPGDTAAEMIEALRDHLADDGARIARGFAYADFGGLDEHIRHTQRALYLHGIQPFYVPSTMHRNTSDLQLALDAVALCGTETEVDTVVLFSGDRDYVPVVQALQAAGRRVVMVSFRDHLSAHLLENTASGYFLDAAELMSDEAHEHFRDEEEAPSPEMRTEFNEVKELPYDIDIEALEVIERYFGQYEEVYLTPLLRKLSEELGDIEGHDPKSMIGDLEDCGAVRLERRRGMPYDYTVLLVNREHPAVIEVKEDLGGDTYGGDGFDATDFDAGYDDDDDVDTDAESEAGEETEDEPS